MALAAMQPTKTSRGSAQKNASEMAQVTKLNGPCELERHAPDYERYELLKSKAKHEATSPEEYLRLVREAADLAGI